MTNTTNTETRTRQLQHLACIIDVAIKTMQRRAEKCEIADTQEFKIIKDILIDYQEKTLETSGTPEELFAFLTCVRTKREKQESIPVDPES